MKLSLKDWIKVGPGLLYGAPFVSRCLLYRFYEDDCAFLVYHRSNVSTVTHADGETGTAISSASFGQPDAVYVHFTPTSAKTSLQQLASLSPRRIELSDVRANHCTLSGLTLQLDPHKLPMRGLSMLGPERDKLCEYQIGNTDYWALGPAPVRTVGKVMATGDLQYPCWRLTVNCIDKGGGYDLASSRSWSLTALEDEGYWQPRLEMHLERKL